MSVLDQRVERGRAITAADGENGKLAVEGDELFEDERPAAEQLPSLFRLRGGAQDALPFAVVTETSGLEDGRQADDVQGGLEVRSGSHRPERRHRNAHALEEVLFAHP